MAARPTVGARAPDFEALDDKGARVRLADFHGRWLVLYFYPRDETRGCVAEACGFRDRFGEFTASGAAVVGVSPDDVATHRAFAERRRLPFPLLADTERRIIRAYGADFLGLGLATRRKTVVIDPDGVVRAVHEDNLRADAHVPRALALLEREMAAARAKTE